MGSTFAVSTERLSAGSGTIVTASTDVESSVDSMMGILVAMQDEWSGEASASFQELVASWRVTQRMVKQNLDEIAQALAQAGEAYESAEAGVRAAFVAR